MENAAFIEVEKPCVTMTQINSCFECALWAMHLPFNMSTCSAAEKFTPCVS